MLAEDVRIFQKVRVSHGHELGEWRGQVVTVSRIDDLGHGKVGLDVTDEGGGRYDGFEPKDVDPVS